MTRSRLPRSWLARFFSISTTLSSVSGGLDAALWAENPAVRVGGGRRRWWRRRIAEDRREIQGEEEKRLVRCKEGSLKADTISYCRFEWNGGDWCRVLVTITTNSRGFRRWGSSFGISGEVIYTVRVIVTRCLFAVGPSIVFFYPVPNGLLLLGLVSLADGPIAFSTSTSKSVDKQM